jgi:hypothetical protein
MGLTFEDTRQGAYPVSGAMPGCVRGLLIYNRLGSKWFKPFYIGKGKSDNTHDNTNDSDKRQSPLYLPWPSWAMQHR